MQVKAASTPIIEDITPSTFSRESNHAINYPATVNVDDLLILVFTCDDNEQITIEGEGTKWINIYEEDAGSSGPTLVVAWCKAVGDEDGGTFNVGTGSSEGSCAYVFRITGSEDPDTQPPEVSLEASGNNDSPDPWGIDTGESKDYLWIAAEGNDDDDDTTGYPSNMADNNEYLQVTTVTLGIATVESTTDMFNPDEFTIANSETWEAVTIAVHPGGGGPANYERTASFSMTYAVESSRHWDLSRAQVQSLTLSPDAYRTCGLFRESDQDVYIASGVERTWDALKTASQSLTASSDAFKDWSLSRSQTQSIALSTDSHRIWSLTRSPSQSLSFDFNALAKIYQLIQRTATMGLTFTPNVARSWALLRNISQGITSSFDGNRILNAVRGATQSITSTFNSKRLLSAVRSVSQGFTSSFNTLRSWDTSRNPYQELTISTNTGRLWTLSRTISQTTSITFNAKRTLTAIRVVTQQISPTFNGSSFLHAFRTANQGLSAAFDSGRMWATSRSVSQGLSFTSNALADLFEFISRSVSMNFDISSNAERMVHFLRSQSNTLNFTLNTIIDFTEAVGEFYRTVTVQLSVSSDSFRDFSAIREATQSISATFNSKRIWTAVRSVSQNISVTPNAFADFFDFISRTASLDFNIGANANRIVNFVRTQTQALGFSFDALMNYIPFEEEFKQFYRTVTVQLSFTSNALGELHVIIVRSVSLSINFTVNAVSELTQFLWGLLTVGVQTLVGDGLENSTVILCDVNSTVISVEYTDFNGTIPAQNLTAGDYTIMVSKEGYVANQTTLSFYKDQVLGFVLKTVDEATMIVNEFDAASLAILALGVIFTVIYFMSDKHWQPGVIAFGAWAISAMITIGKDAESWPQATFFAGLAMTLVILMMMDVAGAKNRDFWDMGR